MKRPLIILLILLFIFALFFYFSLGTQPQSAGTESTTPPTGSPIDAIIKNNPKDYPYVYLEGQGYVLKDRRVVLLVGQDTAQARQADAIKSVENELERYWKWQIFSGKKNLEDINITDSPKEYANGVEKTSRNKNIFSRILDVFKVADAVNVVIDKNKTCDCDDDLLLLSGPDLHLINTTLNPDGGGFGSGVPSDEPFVNKPNRVVSMKQTQTSPETGGDKAYAFTVGIIDTGINSEYEKLISSSLNTALNYNFFDKTNNIQDPNPVQHGTKIANIILTETSNQRISVVGLKTYDKNNIGNVYDNLCAMLYAIKHKMNVVNASWGVHSTKPMPIFDAVMQKAKDANMVVVCSAGNDKYDIDKNPYYPACYADHAVYGSHLVSVTSKYKTTVCQNSSSSAKKIDVSVEADSACKHLIPHPSTGIPTYERGTSYAAPYVTAAVLRTLTISGFSKSGFVSSLPAGGNIKPYTN